MSRWGLAVTLAGTAVVAAPATSASANPCVVRNTTTGARYSSLAPALAAAGRNRTLSLSGVCVGGETIAANLTLAAAGPGAVLEGAGGGGNQNGGDAVLTIAGGADVVVRGLTIAGGQRGVYNENGNLTLFLCTIRHNSGGGGGGGILNDGSLQVAGTTVVDNETNGGGGGIFNFDGTVSLSGNSAVDDNQAHGGGGGIDNDGGTVTLYDGSSVDGNVAAATGGGIDNFFATATLNGHSSIEGNSAGDGGGVHNVSATLALARHSIIAYNESGDGISNDCGTLVGVLQGVNVYGNVPQDVVDSCGGGS